MENNIWDAKTVLRIGSLFRSKFTDSFLSMKTDRKNRSALWNKYLENYQIKIVRSPRTDDKNREFLLIRVLRDLINHNNDLVAESIIIDNPDRPGQYLLIKREVAERILVLGMI